MGAGRGENGGAGEPGTHDAMTPSLPVPTDNIFKFACLFGLALIIAGLFSFVSIYSSSLDRKIKYSEVLIPLEAKAQRSKAEDDILALNKRLIEVTRANEVAGYGVVGAALAAGLFLSGYGAKKWHRDIQQRDDRLALLQIEKLEVEIAKLRMELRTETPAADKDDIDRSVDAD